MSKTRLAPLLALLATVAGFAPRPAAGFPTPPTQFVDELVAGPFDAPTNSSFLPDGRLLVVEQYTAQVRLIVKGQIAAVDPVGMVPGIRSGGEAGLLGVAVDPGFPARPYVYLHGTWRGPTAGTNAVRIWRYTLTGDLAFTGDGALQMDPASQYVVLADGPDAAPSHNGGTLRFGPDGRLYASIGDDENPCRALAVNRLNGKILRLDVSTLPPGGGGPPRYATIAAAGNPFLAHPDSAAWLVWAMGLRNPFTFQVDPATGCLHVGDVGNTLWEELDVACTPGRNFGWPHWEANQRTGITCPAVDTTQFVAPVHAYFHEGAGWSVFSGPVYHAPPGATAPYPASYENQWFYGDTWRSFVRRLVPAGGGAWAPGDSVPGQPNATDWMNGMRYITSMHVGPDGSLWYTVLYRVDPDGPGEVRRIRYVAPAVGVDPSGPGGAGSGGLALVAAHPSPARADAGTELVWRQPRPAPVSLRILDLRGRLVRRLVAAQDGVRAAGEHRRTWDGRDGAGRRVPAGVYVARIEGAGATSALRIVRL